MVDKVALKYVKTRDASLLALPLGVYQHFAGDLQLIVSELGISRASLCC